MYILSRVKQFGDYIVYKRQWNEPGVKKFSVSYKGQMIEEFKTKAQAVKYAEKRKAEQ